MHLEATMSKRATTVSCQPSAGYGDAAMVKRLLSISKNTRALFGLKLGEIALHNGQDELLMALDGRKPVAVSALADRLSVRPSTVSKMVDRLSEKGLVERLSKARDARITNVRLTLDGLDMQDRIRSIWELAESELTKNLADVEQEQLLDALDIADEIVSARLRRLR